MGDSTKKIPKVPHEQMDWKEVLEYLKKTQDMWWLNEIVVDGKKKTKLEVAIEKGRSFKKEKIFEEDMEVKIKPEERTPVKIRMESNKNELFAPKNWLTNENYRTYVRRTVEILQKYKDKNMTLDGDTDQAFEELKEEQKKFEDKPIKNLNDKSIYELSKLLKNILQMEGDEGEDISANAIWNVLKKELTRNNRKYDKNGILIKFVPSTTSFGILYWVKGKNKSEIPCSFRTLQNKLAKIRKNTH